MDVEVRKSGLTEFFQKEYWKLVAYARKLISDTADRDAEDIVQDVFTNIFHKADFTIPINNLSAYVYRSLKNRIVDLFRKKSTAAVSGDWQEEIEFLSLSRWLQERENEPSTLLEIKEDYQRLISAIGTLRREEKAVLVATEFEGRSYSSLAQEWDLPIGTLLARKFRAVQKIRELVR
jgi:RNA polymerase sigma factor (sigma-70 family)